MFRVLTNILLLASVSLLSAGAQEVSGFVRDSLSGELLPGAFVMLMDSTGRVLEYGGTDSDGIFVLTVSKAEAGSFIEVSMMGYAPKKLYSPFQDRYEVALREEALSLETLIR